MTKINPIVIMRSPLARARGLGSARSGRGDWWAERLTSLLLVPLSLYFVLSVFLLEGADQAAMIRYMAEPWNTVLFLALITSLFYHIELGLRAVIEDYTHSEGRRLVTILIMRATVLFFGILAAISVLKLAFS
ncbi:MAG TPA: succinate dehydrogenase, hydrophobic membrane anchor protein [Acetobacteraceae bacterium]|nr:succinate dehydrogenase, hydrophobic membrane anchor protein [Acetobacteraceae bacterium]